MPEDTTTPVPARSLRAGHWVLGQDGQTALRIKAVWHFANTSTLLFHTAPPWTMPSWKRVSRLDAFY